MLKHYMLLARLFSSLY